jgi:hypothetical protein
LVVGEQEGIKDKSFPFVILPHIIYPHSCELWLIHNLILSIPSISLNEALTGRKEGRNNGTGHVMHKTKAEWMSFQDKERILNGVAEWAHGELYFYYSEERQTIIIISKPAAACAYEGGEIDGL